jgi:hypothetical protein
MNPIAITAVLVSMLILYLLFSGKWDGFIDALTGHETSAGSNLGSGATKAAGKAGRIIKHG